MNRGRGLTRTTKDKLFSLLLALPAVVMTVVCILVPVVDSIIKSFTKYQIKNIISGKPGTWNNFGNYIKLFQNAKLPQAITNTFIFVIVVVLSAFILGMALSLILNGGVKGAKIIQGVMMTPWVIPTVISALIWMWLFQPQYGLIKYLASLVTGGAVSNLAVLNNPKTALLETGSAHDASSFSRSSECVGRTAGGSYSRWRKPRTKILSYHPSQHEECNQHCGFHVDY